MINEYFLFFMDNKSGWKTNEKKLSKKEPKIYEEVKKFIENNSLNYLPFQQQVWHFINKYTEIPKCAECNKELIFKRSLKEGYGKYCSLSCTNKNKEHIEKSKKTWLGKFEETQKKIKKTNKERYGVENTYQNLELVKNGFIKNHGVDHVSKVEGVTERKKLTNMEKYGKPTILSTPEVLGKTHDTRRKYFIEKYDKFNFSTHTGDTLNILCQTCNKNYDIHRNSFRYRVLVGVNPCTLCNPINESVSIQEKELQKLITEITDGNCLLNDRTLISPKELDIFIPDKKLAIEFNGVYWHSEFFVEKDYHLKKYLNCKSKNVDLIQIFQDEWEVKKDIVTSLIKNRLGINGKNVIYARKCEIKLVDNKEHNDFLNKNHIQGKVNSSVKLGLYYKDELVSLMTFGRLRKSLGSKHVEGEWELIRFCNKLNYNVLGGASRLFKSFIKTYDPQKILSFSDNRLFNGNMYKLLGFEYKGYSKPSYFYVINGIRHHRYNFRKDVLVAEGYDKNKTEHQIMEERGIPRIYDCGNKKWVWKPQTHLL